AHTGKASPRRVSASSGQRTERMVEKRGVKWSRIPERKKQKNSKKRSYLTSRCCPSSMRVRGGDHNSKEKRARPRQRMAMRNTKPRLPNSGNTIGAPRATQETLFSAKTGGGAAEMGAGERKSRTGSIDE